MAARARVAVMLSGNGTTMSSLLFHSRLPDCPYEIVLVASNVPEARGLAIAAAGAEQNNNMAGNRAFRLFIVTPTPWRQDRRSKSACGLEDESDRASLP